MFLFYLKVYVRIKDEEWNVYKRYKQFNELHAIMKKKHPLTGKFDFPQKKTFGKKVRENMLSLRYVKNYIKVNGSND